MVSNVLSHTLFAWIEEKLLKVDSLSSYQLATQLPDFHWTTLKIHLNKPTPSFSLNTLQATTVLLSRTLVYDPLVIRILPPALFYIFFTENHSFVKYILCFHTDPFPYSVFMCYKLFWHFKQPLFFFTEFSDWIFQWDSNTVLYNNIKQNNFMIIKRKNNNTGIKYLCKMQSTFIGSSHYSDILCRLALISDVS